MPLLLIPLFFLSLLFQEPPATETMKEIHVIEKANKGFTTDRLGQLYIINDYTITMFNKSGDSLREFNSRKYGNISFVDATDPYQILVFFRDYNLVLFLDNFLSENGSPLDLQELGYDQVSLACQSREKGLWIFDPLRQKLLKLNPEFKVSDESINLGQWFGKNLQPVFMLEQNNRLYLKSEEEELIYVFDHFGTYLKKIKLSGAAEIQVLEGFINFMNADQFCQYSLKNLETQCKKAPKKNQLMGRVEKGRFYSGDSKRISIYQTN